MRTTDEHAGAASMNRRDFLALSAGAAAAAALPGCITNPVTGQKQLMLISEAEEINIDKQNSPHQFSEDYGVFPVGPVNAYVEKVGQGIAAKSHRPNMPYSFRTVNASHVNAYAFPGGSIATTRGILLKMENEAELSALLGHEIGHVNARHTAAQMSKGLLLQLAVAGIAIAASQKEETYGEIASVLGGLGAGLLLARYSRSDERQADELGMEYMVRAGYNPAGMVQLMEMLQSLRSSEPNVLELMFATHPMSKERYDTAVSRSRSKYAGAGGLPLERERYMDSLAPVRRFEKTCAEIQKGDKAANTDRFGEAEQHYAAAIKETPDDYEALLKMSKCLIAMNRQREAKQFAERAKRVAPQEAQAYQVSGTASLQMRDFGGAHANFVRNAELLPGNPGIVFLDGLALENMGHRPQAADAYRRYLQSGASGGAAQHAFQRLTEWNAINP